MVWEDASRMGIHLLFKKAELESRVQTITLVLV